MPIDDPLGIEGSTATLDRPDPLGIERQASPAPDPLGIERSAAPKHDPLGIESPKPAQTNPVDVPQAFPAMMPGIGRMGGIPTGMPKDISAASDVATAGEKFGERMKQTGRSLQEMAINALPVPPPMPGGGGYGPGGMPIPGGYQVPLQAREEQIKPIQQARDAAAQKQAELDAKINYRPIAAIGDTAGSIAPPMLAGMVNPALGVGVAAAQVTGDVYDSIERDDGPISQRDGLRGVGELQPRHGYGP